MNRTCQYFEKIMSIPRPSGKEEKIADFICDFAKKRDLEFFRDNVQNVIIKKNNHSKNTLILQCHTDMVCVSTYNKDFEKEGIDWFIDGDFYKAKGTTLGADNGIGVAMILSLLDETNKDLPNIEAIFTTQEETTMLGATELDYSKIKGKTLISLDGVEEGVLEVSSAGMCNITLTKQLSPLSNPKNAKFFKIEISELLGGHSGDDICKDRINAINLLSQILEEMKIIGISSLNAGAKHNVIPSSAECEFSTVSSKDEVLKIVEKYSKVTEENNTPTIKIYETLPPKKSFDFRSVNNFILNFTHGVIAKTEDNFPIASENMGVINLENGKITILMSLRSSRIDLEEKSLAQVEQSAKENGLEYKLELKKPFFPFKEKSYLREVLSKSYQQLFNKNTIIRHVHACMEGGVFSQNIKDLDICTISPNVYDIHTINERISISSINRVYEWLMLTLKNF